MYVLACSFCRYSYLLQTHTYIHTLQGCTPATAAASYKSHAASPVRGVLRRSLLLLVAAFSLGGAVTGGAVAAWGRGGSTGQQGQGQPRAAAELVVGRGPAVAGKPQPQPRIKTRGELLLLAARTVVPMPIRVVGEDGEEILDEEEEEEEGAGCARGGDWLCRERGGGFGFVFGGMFGSMDSING